MHQNGRKNRKEAQKVGNHTEKDGKLSKNVKI